MKAGFVKLGKKLKGVERSVCRFWRNPVQTSAGSYIYGGAQLAYAGASARRTHLSSGCSEACRCLLVSRRFKRAKPLELHNDVLSVNKE